MHSVVLYTIVFTVDTLSSVLPRGFMTFTCGSAYYLFSLLLSPWAFMPTYLRDSDHSDIFTEVTSTPSFKGVFILLLLRQGLVHRLREVTLVVSWSLSFPLASRDVINELSLALSPPLLVFPRFEGVFACSSQWFPYRLVVFSPIH